ncbi:hypothetical protein MHYP_G00156510 [Metynnis hypsauchen]
MNFHQLKAQPPETELPLTAASEVVQGERIMQYWEKYGHKSEDRAAISATVYSSRPVFRKGLGQDKSPVGAYS